MTPPTRPTGVRRLLFRLPVRLYRCRLGWLLGGRFVLIEHTGRVSGRARQVVVEVVRRDESTGAVVVAAGFGAVSDWYQNLRARPRARAQVGSHSFAVDARFLDADDAAQEMADYARRHPRAARELVRFMGFDETPDAEGYRRAGAQIPMVRLEPAEGS